MNTKALLKALTQEAENIGQSEYKCLMEFLNDCYEPNNQENKELLLTICQEFIEHAMYIKKELSKCKS
jgi:hypothetical protein